MPSSPTSRRTGTSAAQPGPGRAGHWWPTRRSGSRGGPAGQATRVPRSGRQPAAEAAARTADAPRRAKRPGPPPSRHRAAPGADAGLTRSAVLAAAADAFSRRGFEGASVDDIARAAGVNKAMIYYHFADKLALYRYVVCDMLRAVGARVTAIVDDQAAPADARWRVSLKRSSRSPTKASVFSAADAAGDCRRRSASGCPTRSRWCAPCSSTWPHPRRGRRDAFGASHPVLTCMCILGPLMLFLPGSAPPRAGASHLRGCTVRAPSCSHITKSRCVAPGHRQAPAALAEEDARHGGGQKRPRLRP